MNRNQLSQAEAFELLDWLRAQHARLLQERPTVAEAATQAHEALKFRVSAGNIEGTTKSAKLQPFWRVHQRGVDPQEHAAAQARVERLEKRVAHLEDELSRVMLHIINNGSKNGLIQLQSSHVETVRRMRGGAD